MRRVEEMRVVLYLACEMDDRSNAEQKAMLAVAARLDAEANRQLSSNPLIRGEPFVECTYRDGPPETHGRPGDACKCKPMRGQPPEKVRMPAGGWWRLVELVENTRGI